MNAHLNNAPRAVAAASSVRIGVLAVLLGALTPSAGPPLAAPIVGSCQPARVKFVSELNERSTSSLSFVNMPGTTINFIQGGASNSCVIVDFSADVATGSGTKMVVAATLDNVLGGANPNSRQFVADSQLFQSHAGSFIFTAVAPGAHTVRIKWRSQTGVLVVVVGSNTIVHHAP